MQIRAQQEQRGQEVLPVLAGWIERANVSLVAIEIIDPAGKQRDSFDICKSNSLSIKIDRDRINEFIKDKRRWCYCLGQIVISTDKTGLVE
jgi:hypothetical protein